MGALRRLLWRPNLDAIALKWLRLHLDYKVDGKTGQDRPAAGCGGSVTQPDSGEVEVGPKNWTTCQGV